MTDNKYFQLLLFAVLLLASGFVYAQYYRPPEIGQVQATGDVVEIRMRVLENQWKWEPAAIKIKAGDKARLFIYNEDSYDHGFAVDVFGINRRLFPKQTTLVEFTASTAGVFNFYCSVPCGEGHYEQVGRLIVEGGANKF